MSLSNFKVSAKCHAIASPSRSSSLANQTISAFLAKSFSFFTTAFLSFETSYFGLKSPSTSTPNSLEGKSAICPKLDSTLKSFPRNFSMVFAFAGDSTITKFFAILHFLKLQMYMKKSLSVAFYGLSDRYLNKKTCF